MPLFRSANPTLREDVFQPSLHVEGEGKMTIRGTLAKTAFLLLMVLCSAVYSWSLWSRGMNVTPYMYGGILGGFVVAIVIVFKKNWSGYLAPAYCLFEGLFLGAVSAMFNHYFAEKAPFIVIQAVGLTFGTAIAMLLLYGSRIIRPTQKFKLIVFSATLGIGVFYFISILLRFFGIDIAFIHEGSPLGIVFSLIVVAIAALNLVMDFELIEKGSREGAPQYMEWYAAFGLMVTLIWLYIEILRLLAKLYSRR
ncbi:Bax inhibitor-1/YccA family protein [Compostibacter hankyongensis]|uniref:Bax inhibitor-1/YccA family protein n=1 Tax=Compostibacter hankyongensis TaxID=1007089 RepID=A0ABP8FEP3_9BACT